MDLVNTSGVDSEWFQDDWSLKRLKFGKEAQLEVVGWNGKRGESRYYIVKCSICANDPELFGSGLFRTPKGSLILKQVPCGCSRVPKWNEDQFAILCKRKAEDMGLTFLGWGEDFHGRSTKINMLCDEHGEWYTGNIHNLINHNRGCRKCGERAVGLLHTKPVDVMLASFFASGQFPIGTEFWKNDTRQDGKGRYDYWNVYCPECNTTAVSLTHTIQKGSRSCLCSRARQQEGYINWVVDENNQTIAIKFGIANMAKKRAYQQNWRCIYEVRNYLIYAFPDKSSCWAAERECKQTLVCGILTKGEMPDGYTETTDVLNLVRIKRIYEKHGGVLNCDT